MDTEKIILYLFSSLQSLTVLFDFFITLGREWKKHKQEYGDDEVSVSTAMSFCCNKEIEMKRLSFHIMSIFQSCVGITGIFLLIFFDKETIETK